MKKAQWYLLVKGIATYNGYCDSIDAGRAGQIAPVFPASPLPRPGPHDWVLRRRRILPGLRRSLLLPALARVRDRLRPLPPRPRQEPGPTLVGLAT
jgi:hypothetical protein